MSLTDEQIRFLLIKSGHYFALEDQDIVFADQATIDEQLKSRHKPGTVNGLIGRVERSDCQIIISRDQSVGCAFQTILHELAHIHLGHIGCGLSGGCGLEQEIEAIVLAYEYLYHITKAEAIEADGVAKAEAMYAKALQKADR